jgi:hypothetical protein
MTTLVILSYAIGVLTVMITVITYGLRHAYRHPLPPTRQQQIRALLVRYTADAQQITQAYAQMSKAVNEANRAWKRAEASGLFDDHKP